MSATKLNVIAKPPEIHGAGLPGGKRVAVNHEVNPHTTLVASIPKRVESTIIGRTYSACDALPTTALHPSQSLRMSAAGHYGRPLANEGFWEPLASLWKSAFGSNASAAVDPERTSCGPISSPLEPRKKPQRKGLPDPSCRSPQPLAGLGAGRGRSSRISPTPPIQRCMR
jgi:hypothetical protein